MPNVPYLFVSLLYNLGLAIWIGGTVVLGGLVAPTLFSNLDRRSAGDSFGTILRKFVRARIASTAMIVFAAAVKFAIWEGTNVSSLSPWIMIRWVLITAMASTVLYELFSMEPALARSLAGMRAQGEESDEGRRFRALHRRSESLMKISLVAAVGALILG